MPAGCSAVHHPSLCLAIQPVLSPAKGTPFQDVGCQVFQEYAEGGSAKGFVEVQVGYVVFQHIGMACLCMFKISFLRYILVKEGIIY